MIRTFCDLCKKEAQLVRLQVHNPRRRSTQPSYKVYDLCEECQVELLDYLESKTKTEVHDG